MIVLLSLLSLLCLIGLATFLVIIYALCVSAGEMDERMGLK